MNKVSNQSVHPEPVLRLRSGHSGNKPFVVSLSNHKLATNDCCHIHLFKLFVRNL